MVQYALRLFQQRNRHSTKLVSLYLNGASFFVNSYRDIISAIALQFGQLKYSTSIVMVYGFNLFSVWFHDDYFNIHNAVYTYLLVWIASRY